MGNEQNNGSTAIVMNAPTGATVTDGFGTQALARQAETAATAVAAQARAAVESRYIMAMQRPRDLDAARLAILKECKRPGFAAVARYRKPVGDGIEGPSIRFAEAAIRCMTNMLPETATIYEDQEKRIVRVSVTDLEANVTYSGDVTIEKTVERTKLKAILGDASGVEGDSYRVRWSTNKAGNRVFTVKPIALRKARAA